MTSAAYWLGTKWCSSHRRTLVSRYWGPFVCVHRNQSTLSTFLLGPSSISVSSTNGACKSSGGKLIACRYATSYGHRRLFQMVMQSQAVKWQLGVLQGRQKCASSCIEGQSVFHHLIRGEWEKILVRKSYIPLCLFVHNRMHLYILYCNCKYYHPHVQSRTPCFIDLYYLFWLLKRTRCMNNSHDIIFQTDSLNVV